MLTSSPEETKGFAAQFAVGARMGDIYLLTGQLGAGKTAFVQGFLAAMGVTHGVTSPTYVYETKHETLLGPIYHLDLYRAEGVDRLYALGLEERLGDKDTILLIEWPEVLVNHLAIPRERRVVRIAIAVKDERSREIRITTDAKEGEKKPSETRQEA